jgi:hypothetical protein
MSRLSGLNIELQGESKIITEMIGSFDSYKAKLQLLMLYSNHLCVLNALKNLRTNFH